MYSFYLKEMEKIEKHHHVTLLGESKFGRKIHGVFCGDPPYVLVVGGIHAREFITTFLVLELAGKKKQNGVIYIPLANPDGVEIARRGLASVPQEFKKDVEKFFTSGENFKANGNLVDVNQNFDAGFSKGKFNTKNKGEANYVGPHSFSEIESRILRDVCLDNQVVGVISYHSKGEVIYFRYHQKEHLARDEKIGRKVADITGYQLVLEEIESHGGLKDWVIEKLKIPALTIEVGADELEHPIERKHLAKIFKENKNVVEEFAKLCREV